MQDLGFHSWKANYSRCSQDNYVGCGDSVDSEMDKLLDRFQLRIKQHIDI